jgi:Domain of unknown function (DUF309)
VFTSGRVGSTGGHRSFEPNSTAALSHTLPMLHLHISSSAADRHNLLSLWQGLAQICVGLTHAARGNTIGATRLLERGAARIDAYAAVGGPAYGLDLTAVAACARRNTGTPY